MTEVLIAASVFLIGAVSVAQLLAITTVMNLSSRYAAEATRLAQAKVEELAKLDFDTNPSIQITAQDTLNSNVANYFDTQVGGLVTRRWLVQAGPTASVRLVTVRVINRPGSPGTRTIDLTTMVREW